MITYVHLISKVYRIIIITKIRNICNLIGGDSVAAWDRALVWVCYYRWCYNTVMRTSSLNTRPRFWTLNWTFDFLLRLQKIGRLFEKLCRLFERLGHVFFFITSIWPGFSIKRISKKEYCKKHHIFIRIYLVLTAVTAIPWDTRPITR